MSKKLLLLEVNCPNCHAGLTEGNRVVLDAFIPANHQDGEVRLSALFGDYSVTTDLEIPDNAVAEFRCPKCDQPLQVGHTCKICSAPMVALDLASGGFIEFCTRRGCRGHALGGVGDIDQLMNLMNRMFETPYD